MKIVIMAAGLGQRFRAEGFEVPKPLIMFKGKPIIDYSIDQFPDYPRDHIIVVGTPEVCYYLKGAHPEIQTVCVKNTQRGPGMSALLAGGYINDDESVVFVDCDILLPSSYIQQFAMNLAGRNSLDGSLLFTRLGEDVDSSPYCSVLIDSGVKTLSGAGLSYEVIALEEKTGKSKQIAVGVYGFKRWKEFRFEAMAQAVRLDNAGEKTEVYMSAILNNLLIRGSCVEGSGVPLEVWTCLGTPRELAEVLKGM